MKELRDIVKAYEEATVQGKRAALATVVQVQGSSYRRPGARMLVTEDGLLTGAISGGCLEGDALRKALHVMIQQESLLVTYDTNDEDDAKFGMGLGCNGIIQVLFEPINSSATRNPIEFLKIVIAKREPGVLVTLFSLEDKKAQQPGTCLLLKEKEIISNNRVILKDELVTEARSVLDNQQSFFKSFEYGTQNISAFIEFVQPSLFLVIAGAGNDVMPLVAMAQVLGWDVLVVDGRNNYAKKERFPADCQVVLAKPGDILNQITIDVYTAFVLMTHNYNYDLAMLQGLVTKNVMYIGLLGPRKKRDRIMQELIDGGISLTSKQLDNVYGPIGLDIGAETPAEIAVSIIAEIKAVFAGKKGKSLREGGEFIHFPRSDHEGIA